MSEPGNASDRDATLAEIAALMQRHHITAAELQDFLTKVSAPTTGQSPRAGSLLVRVLSYIGGLFVFAGIAIFIALQWEALNSASRVIITFGSGVAGFIMAVIALSDTRYQHLTLPLLLISAVLQPTGMMVAFAEYGSGGDPEVAALVTAATFAVQFGFTFMRWRQTAMAWLTTFFTSAAFGFGADLAEVPQAGIALALGLGWLSLGLATVQGRYALLSTQLFLIGCWASLWGLFDLVEGGWAEVLFVAAACGLVYLGVWCRSRALNLASAVALLAYTGYFTGHYFADSIGWPIALILIGLVMIAISAAALRIDRSLLRHT